VELQIQEMKKMNKILLVCIALVLVVGVAFPQNVSVERLLRNNGSGLAGSTWAASATHYTEWFATDYDSAHIFIVCPDTVKAGVTVQGSGVTDGTLLVASNSTVDSISATASAAGLAIGFSIQDNSVLGAPFARQVIAFSANTNDTQLTEKYKIWIKKFRH
jgi:hypothetical protein